MNETGQDTVAEVGHHLCSPRPTSMPFPGQPFGEPQETVRSAYGPIQTLQCHSRAENKTELNMQTTRGHFCTALPCATCCLLSFKATERRRERERERERERL